MVRGDSKRRGLFSRIEEAVLDWEESSDFADWLRKQIEAEPYWFHRIELGPGVVTPGWSDPATEKLPYFGLPADMSGMRVLDVGCSEGYFSFEAERRGAASVVALDTNPNTMRRFHLCRIALDSKVTGYLSSVYELSPRTMGTFDLVMFFGVLYHLRHPLLALEKIRSVCSGTLLMQTNSFEDDAITWSASQFHPFGITSGPADNRVQDPTVLWIPNLSCAKDMLAHVGFTEISGKVTPASAVLRAVVPSPSAGSAPDPMTAPWA